MTHPKALCLPPEYLHLLFYGNSGKCPHPSEQKPGGKLYFYHEKGWEKGWDAVKRHAFRHKEHTMKKYIGLTITIIYILFAMTGCSAIGSKSASPSVLYISTAVISFLLLIGCTCLVRKKALWFYVLFASVFIVNTGYLALALSPSLQAALISNRLAYLGSVCLPMSMLMIIMNVCRLRYRRWFPGILTVVAASVFLIAASPGILDIYYKEVSLSVINGMTILEKVYGPLHCVYLFYLLGYFVLTVAVIAHAWFAKKIDSPAHIIILAAVVFINMGVWLIEQLTRLDFELLSVSYILSELLLLGIYLIIQENSTARQPVTSPAPENYIPVPANPPAAPVAGEQIIKDAYGERCAFFASQLSRLTPTEKIIYQYYLDGMRTREILEVLNIKENTLKYHNKNIYGKLGVSSRKELVEIASTLNQKDSL